MRVVHPQPAETTVAEQVATLYPSDRARADRPFVAVNFAATLDGRASIDGRSKQIGSRTDSEMLHGLRSRFDAVMVGAETLRAERYARLITDPQVRALRERQGLPHDPLAVIVSDTMDLPWDAPLFTAGAGRVLIFTGSAAQPPPVATSLRVERHPNTVDLTEALRHLRRERGVRSVLCEGGPRLHGGLQAAHLVDEVFLTISPVLGYENVSGILEGDLPAQARLELIWLLEHDGEAFARYRRA